MEVGFCDQSHLTRHFQHVVGVTPGEYLRLQESSIPLPSLPGIVYTYAPRGAPSRRRGRWYLPWHRVTTVLHPLHQGGNRAGYEPCEPVEENLMNPSSLLFLSLAVRRTSRFRIARRGHNKPAQSLRQSRHRCPWSRPRAEEWTSAATSCSSSAWARVPLP
jgi:hypothetical protein